jgi:hypothetical protein
LRARWTDAKCCARFSVEKRKLRHSQAITLRNRGVEATSKELATCTRGLERPVGIDFITDDPWSFILELLDLSTIRKEVGGDCLIIQS